MKKSIAVLGLGKYGTSLVRALDELDADVMAVDKDEEAVKNVADLCTEAVCADLADEKSLQSLGLSDMDIVVVAIGGNLEASIFSVAAAKEQGVPLIVAKSSSDRMSSILRKVGADKVIMPEEYTGRRSAAILASDTFLDYFQVDKNLSMIEMLPIKEWIGKTLLEMKLRSNYQINVIAVKDENNHWSILDPETPIKENSKLLVVLDQKSLNRIKG